MNHATLFSTESIKSAIPTDFKFRIALPQTGFFGGKMKILIVDDDPGILNAVKAGLISYDFQVTAVQNGYRALDIIESSMKENQPFEFLITDLKMPGMNGMDLIRSAREVAPDLPAILMTAYGDEDILREAVELDHCGYMEKPFKTDNLVGMIHEMKAWSGNVKIVYREAPL